MKNLEGFGRQLNNLQTNRENGTGDVGHKEQRLADFYKELELELNMIRNGNDFSNSNFNDNLEKIRLYEKEFLNLPENIGEGKRGAIEEFVNSDEFLRLQAELKESAEKVREEFIEKTTEDIIRRSEEFRLAVNGDVAEKLFRIKFPIYFRENLLNSDTDVTHYTFHLRKLLNENGEDVLYFEDISIVNKPRDNSVEEVKIKDYTGKDDKPGSEEGNKSNNIDLENAQNQIKN
jgi:hypothetical protein